MKITFNNCIKTKRIFKAAYVLKLIKYELQDAKEDLDSAQEAYSKASYKWSTIQAYYSMFHSARALLFSKGYGEKGHYCLYLALKELFVKKNLLSELIAEKFLNSMILRENADYKRDYSQQGAEAVIESAKEFLKSTKKILKK